MDFSRLRARNAVTAPGKKAIWICPHGGRLLLLDNPWLRAGPATGHGSRESAEGLCRGPHRSAAPEL